MVNISKRYKVKEGKNEEFSISLPTKSNPAIKLIEWFKDGFPLIGDNHHNNNNYNQQSSSLTSSSTFKLMNDDNDDDEEEEINDEQQFKFNPQRIIINGQSLIIKSISRNDKGYYMLKSSNDIGSSNISFHLNVLCKYLFEIFYLFEKYFLFLELESSFIFSVLVVELEGGD